MSRTNGTPRTTARRTVPGEQLCSWYALCDKPAEGTVTHPILGDVPCCGRCRDKHNMSDRFTAY